MTLRTILKSFRLEMLVSVIVGIILYRAMLTNRGYGDDIRRQNDQAASRDNANRVTLLEILRIVGGK